MKIIFVKVSINTTGVAFIGFMLQAKTISKGELIPAPADGYWKAASSFSKTLDCFSIQKVKLKIKNRYDLILEQILFFFFFE